MLETRDTANTESRSVSKNLPCRLWPISKTKIDVWAIFLLLTFLLWSSSETFDGHTTQRQPQALPPRTWIFFSERRAPRDKGEGGIRNWRSPFERRIHARTSQRVDKKRKRKRCLNKPRQES